MAQPSFSTFVGKGVMILYASIIGITVSFTYSMYTFMNSNTPIKIVFLI